MWPWGPWVQIPLLTPFFMRPFIVRENSPKAYKLALSLIRNKGVMVCPAYTAYGFSAFLFDYYSNKRIFRIKKRNLNMPLIIITNKEMILEQAKNVDKELLNELLSLSATVIVKTKDRFPRFASLDGKSAFRAANTTFLKRVTKYCPITSTSVNISRRSSMNDIERIIKIFGRRIDLIVAGDVLGEISTIVEVEKNRIAIVRKGHNFYFLEKFFNREIV